MEKVKKAKCFCVSWCFCYVCFFLNALIFCFLIVKGLDLNWHCICIKNIILVFLLFANLVCIIVTNIKILSEKDDCNNKLEQVTTEYKAFVRSELKYLSSDSFNTNDDLCKTLEMITKKFNDKNCDDAKLEILKEVIDAVIKSREKNQQTNSSVQGQEKEKKH